MLGQVVGSALRATLGFLLIGAGATFVVASLTPLGVMIQGATGAQGVVPTNEAIAGAAQGDDSSSSGRTPVAAAARIAPPRGAPTPPPPPTE